MSSATLPSALETFCQTLERSRLLTSRDLRRLLHLWEKTPGEGGKDLKQFLGWLLSNHYLTAYQLERLAGGHGGPFYLGRYKLLDRIGEGTMGRVYKAICPDGHLFALKVLPPSRAHDPRWRALFENEVREAGRFHHANVVRTFQTGKAEGLHYLVMEFLDGETLEEVLNRRGRLPYGEAVRLIHQALLGLQHIHEQKMVHCNLEPSHLMLVRAPASGQQDTTLGATLKILDAGLGRPLFNAHVEAAGERILEGGMSQVLGHVDDLAPERAGNGAAADIRADIYSLGCILYRCLTGQPPFPGGTILDKLVRHASEEPRPLGEISPDVPEGLRCVVERMMAREPQGRYPEPADAARALIEFLPPETPYGPIPIALPVGRPPAATRRAKALALTARPWLWIAVSAVLLIVLIIVILSWNRSSRTDEPPNSEDDKVAAAKGVAPVPETVIPRPEPRPEPKDVRPPQPKKEQPVPAKDPSDAGQAPPEKNPKPPEKTPKPPSDKQSPEPLPPAPPSRLPIPTETDQIRAHAMIREVFKADYAARGTDFRALAQKLLRQGIDTKDDNTARFVLLREARDLAAQSTDVELALQALDRMSHEYDVDTRKCKVALFALAGKTPLPPAASKNLADKILEAVPEAILADDYSAARQMTVLADLAARRAGLRPLQRKVELLTREVAEIKAESERLAATGINLHPVELAGDAGTDAETRSRLGQFICFFKGDWTRGLPLLAASGEEPLCGLAREDLVPSGETTVQVRRGDAWWMLAESRQGTPRRQLQRHAASWYQQALPGLSGLTRTRIEQRIKLALDL